MKDFFREFTNPEPRPSREEFQRRIDRDAQDPNSANCIFPQPVIYFTDLMERRPILTTASTLSAIILATVGGSYFTHTGRFADKNDSYVCAAEQINAKTEQELVSAAFPLVKGLIITHNSDAPHSQLSETSELVPQAAHRYSSQTDHASFATVCLNLTGNAVEFRPVS